MDGASVALALIVAGEASAAAPEDAGAASALESVAGASEPTLLSAAAAVFSGAVVERLAPADLRPPAPLQGRLFDLLSGRRRGEIIGLLVPVVWLAGGADRAADADAHGGTERPADDDLDGAEGRADGRQGATSDGPSNARRARRGGGRPQHGALVAITDHVALAGPGPLFGRWPPGVPRTFPGMTGVYQPVSARSRGGPRLYSAGVVAGGVAEIRRLTPFEVRASREAGCSVASDSLVPVAAVAAYHGLRLAACGLVQAALPNRE